MNNKTKHKMKHKPKNIFLAGLFSVLPLMITGYILYWLFNKIDPILGKWVNKAVGAIFSNDFYIPGLGLVTFLIIIFLLGLFVTDVFGKRIANWFHDSFEKIPIVKPIYSTIRDLLSSVSNKSKSFSQVVMLEFPIEGTKSIGFITNEHPHYCSDKRVAVFIPTTPNPTNGFLVFVEPEKLEYLDMPIEQGLKLVVAMGVLNK